MGGHLDASQARFPPGKQLVSVTGM